jgi:hypothetical protein
MFMRVCMRGKETAKSPAKPPIQQRHLTAKCSSQLELIEHKSRKDLVLSPPMDLRLVAPLNQTNVHIVISCSELRYYFELLVVGIFDWLQ